MCFVARMLVAQKRLFMWTSFGEEQEEMGHASLNCQHKKYIYLYVCMYIKNGTSHPRPATVVPVASDNKSKLYLEQRTPFLWSTFSSLETEHSPVKRRRKINITIYLIMVYYAIVCCSVLRTGRAKRKINYWNCQEKIFLIFQGLC